MEIVNMQTWFIKLISIAFVVCGLVFGFAKWGPGFPISSVVSQKTDLFSVSGEGKVTVVPDTAIVDLGITVSKATAKSAQQDANNVINAVTKALKDLGINEKDIKTQNYSIYPQYDYSAGANRINSYQVNANLQVIVRDIEKANSVIDLATAKGANTVGGVQLTVDEDKRKDLLNQARKLAIDEAKTKATFLAQAAGMTLGKIVNVQENLGLYPRPMYATEMNIKTLGGGGGDTKIQPGSTDISTSVTLFFETR